MIENMERNHVALGRLICYFPWLSNSWRRTADQGIERTGPKRLKTLRCLWRTVIWGLMVISPGSCGMAWARMCRPREALTLQTEFFLPSFMSLSSDISPGQSTQPQHKYALRRLSEISLNKINFLGKNSSLKVHSDFDWPATKRVSSSAAPASVCVNWCCRR